MVCHVSAVVFSRGSRGQVVREIQRRLLDWGYYFGDVDGIFGTGTYEAVVAFQASNGLTPDGIAGPATLEYLGIGSDVVMQQNDLDLLAQIIYGEGRGEPYEGQVAIGAVVLNRVESPLFPNTIEDVIYQRGAFDAVDDGQFYLMPNETAYQAAQDALNGWDPSDGSLYYWNPATATSRWIWSIPIRKTIGRHVFGSTD